MPSSVNLFFTARMTLPLVRTTILRSEAVHQRAPDVHIGCRKLPRDGFRCWVGADSVDLLKRLYDDFARTLDIVAVTDANIVLRTALLESRADSDYARVDIAVGDNNTLSIISPNLRRAGSDGLDRSLIGSRHDLIALPEGLPIEDEKTRYPILQDILESETDRDRTYPKRGKEIGGLDGGEDDGCNHQQPEQQQAPFDKAAEQSTKIVSLPAIENILDP